MNTSQIKKLVIYYKENPEAEICFRKSLKQNSEADFHKKQKCVWSRWKFYRSGGVEMKVKKNTYISNGELKDYYMVQLLPLSKKRLSKGQKNEVLNNG